MSELSPEKRAKILHKRLEDLFKEIKVIRDAAKSVEEDSSKFPEFRGKYKALDGLQNEYTKTYELLFELYVITEKEKEFPIEDKYPKAVRAYVYECHKVYEGVMNPIPQPTSFTGPIAASTHNSANGSMFQNSSTVSMARFRLPKINIPKFEGELSEWIRYRDVFLAIIPEEDSLSPIEKYHHLVGSLSGEPLRIVSAFPLSAANYATAWKALEERYNNKRILAAAYLHRIKQFKPCAQSSSNPNYFRSFLKIVVDNFTSLTHLEIPDEADYLKLQIALDCLDLETRKLFEEKQQGTEFPTYKSLTEFIQQRCKILELSEPPPSLRKNSSLTSNPIKAPKVLTTFANDSNSKPKVAANLPCHRSCPKCKQNHLLFRCYSFKKLPHDKKMEFVSTHRICVNCLREGHLMSKCPSTYSCYRCKKRHHSLLHDTSKNTETDRSNQVSQPSQPSVARRESSSALVGTTAGHNNVLLGTAMANIADWKGDLQPIRVVLDSGSQFSIITEDCVRRLGLHVTPSKRTLCGVGLTQLPTCKGVTSCTLFPMQNRNSGIQAQALIMSSLISNMPGLSVNPSIINCFQDIALADKRFWESRPIDFLLGSDLFFQIVSPGPKIRVTDSFGALPTIFGHVVVGTSPPYYAPANELCLAIAEDSNSDVDLKGFWEIEEVSATHYPHPDDVRCEDHFKSTIKRNSEGRYIVTLPFRDQPKSFPGSRPLALARFRNMELKLTKQPEVRNQYNEFMREYIDLNHMEETLSSSAYVTPHHAVFKMTGNERKIRIVFDASMATPAGSLNDHLLTGPKLQKDIAMILLNFRTHRVALCADIVKMFRQILVTPEHRCYQHILWRFSPEEAVKTYSLRTLTYGQSSSPYLALRVLKQLAEDEGRDFPMASKALQRDIYVDDIITGADSLEEVLKLKSELSELLDKGCFPVHKWASNSMELMSSILKEDKQTQVCLQPEDTTTKVLGLHWDAKLDCFYYKVQLTMEKITKRTMLSIIARLYDPLGFLAPAIFMAKHMIQSLWLHKLDWDDQPPTFISDLWENYLIELPTISEISIPRWIYSSEGKLKLFGFCDASERGYAAVIYLQVATSDVEARTFLLTAKTRLAPLKTISIPRLELCAAHLLMKLLRSLADFCQSNSITDLYLFSDSTIVLSWLRISPQQLKTFVANRVGYILTHSMVHQWYHVPSEENPADVASRGIHPHNLATCELWWKGPTWINKLPLVLPKTPEAVPVPEPPERKTATHTLTTLASRSLTTANHLVETISQFLPLIRTMAYTFRFIHNLKQPRNKTIGSLTVLELEAATMYLIKEAQQEFFQDDYDFKRNECLSSRFKKLAIFQDEFEVLRVGGRLSYSLLPYNSKHPIMLPSKSTLAARIIDDIHQRNFHLGPQALQAYLSRKYYIFGGRSLVRKRVWQCLRCYKLKAKANNPFMANLPISRVSQGRPFISVGVDFAGPFNIKQSNRRNASINKAYLCVFVCMTVKAVHLEIVSDLSTNAFLAAFDRFVARRGLPTEVFSDCGTNFVGAARHLREVYTWLKDNATQEEISRHSSHQGIQWHFNPPYAPHFGGLWEAAVKSAKLHLKRSLGDHPFQFEELSTIMARIEAIMNSRPLCATTSNPDNYDYLTPGHFLIGSALIAPPEQDLTEVNLNRQTRWQLLQSSVRSFWKRWSSEYIHTLQARTKWTKSTPPINLNDLVLLQDPNTSPLHWRLGRVVDLHPGQDEIVRVVTIKTVKGLAKRAVNKLAPLSPINDNQ